MEKAYDLNGLLDEMKQKGLVLAEDAAIVVYESVQNWLLKSATMSPNKYDDLLSVMLPAIDGYVKAQIDKIDGKKG